jgi:hypothetical protein
MKAYQDALNATSTKWAPWHVIPGNHKWFARMAIADIIVDKLKSMDLRYPKVDKVHLDNIVKARKMLTNEKN